MLLLAIAEISRPYLVSTTEETGLSRTWSQTPKTGFLVTRLKQGCKELLTVPHNRPPLSPRESAVKREPQTVVHPVGWRVNDDNGDDDEDNNDGEDDEDE